MNCTYTFNTERSKIENSEVIALTTKLCIYYTKTEGCLFTGACQFQIEDKVYKSSDFMHEYLRGD